MKFESQLLPSRVLIKRLGNVVLAYNRRVHLTLSSTGQQSARTYPLNANDFARLADRNVPKKPVARVELAAQKEKDRELTR